MVIRRYSAQRRKSLVINLPSLIGGIVIHLLLIQAQLERMTATPIAYADTILVVQQVEMPPSFRMDPEASITYWAKKYGQSPEELLYVIENEGGIHQDYTNVIGSSGERGACQILPSAHKEVTLTQMLDPDWCVAWTARMWAEGHAHWWVTHWKFEKSDN